MITKAMFNNVSLLSRRCKKATKQVYMQLLRLHQIHTEKGKTYNYKNSKATSITTRRSLHGILLIFQSCSSTLVRVLQYSHGETAVLPREYWQGI